jgi:hypothetical protein
MSAAYPRTAILNTCNETRSVNRCCVTNCVAMFLAVSSQYILKVVYLILLHPVNAQLQCDTTFTWYLNPEDLIIIYTEHSELTLRNIKLI